MYPPQLLTQSASMRGFFLFDYFNDVKRHGAILAQLIMQGKVKIGVDKGEKASTGPFVGLEKVVDAVEVGVKIELLKTCHLCGCLFMHFLSQLRFYVLKIYYMHNLGHHKT